MNVNLVSNFSFIALLIAIVASSCQKKEETPTQPDKVLVTVSAPQQAQQFAKGDTVWVRAHVSYVSQLHGYQVKISDKESGEELYRVDKHTHGSQFDINEYWVNTRSKNSKLKLEIGTVIDHENNTSVYELEFISQP